MPIVVEGVMACKGESDCPSNGLCNDRLGMCEAKPGFEFLKYDNGTYIRNNGSYIIAGNFLLLRPMLLFIGVNLCPLDIDECARGMDTCSECGVDGIRCKNLPGKYTCVCPSGAEIYKCQCQGKNLQ